MARGPGFGGSGAELRIATERCVASNLGITHWGVNADGALQGIVEERKVHGH